MRAIEQETITDIRVNDPTRVLRIAENRKRRSRVTGTKRRINIIAADHPARRVVAAGGDPLAMMDRNDFLQRIAAILTADAADGVMATVDVLEELLILHERTGFLDDKLLIGSMNRGGLQGTAWELDDPITSALPSSCMQLGFDGVKLLLRVCDDDVNSLNTIRYCSEAITVLNEFELPTFLEPLPVRKSDGKFEVIKEPEQLAKLVGVASALGDSSRNLWLKLPHCENFSVVANATTLPIVLLGGEETFSAGQLRDGLSAGPNVRGTMIGRNVLYPTNGDPVEAARRVHEIVHEVQQ